MTKEKVIQRLLMMNIINVFQQRNLSDTKKWLQEEKLKWNNIMVKKKKMMVKSQSLKMKKNKLNITHNNTSKNLKQEVKQT